MQHILKSFILGAEAGTVLCLTISGILADSHGWECTFYVWGAFGMIWCLLWTILIYENPDDHPRISEDEKSYINSNTRTTYSSSTTTVISLPRAPIMKILTSVPVLATIFTALGQNYGFYTILKMTPTYLNNIQHVSIRNVGTSTLLCNMNLMYNVVIIQIKALHINV